MFDDPAGTATKQESPVHPTLATPFPVPGAAGERQYGLLEQTHDRQLRLGPPPGPPRPPGPGARSTPGPGQGPRTKGRSLAKKSDSHKKREALTKL